MGDMAQLELHPLCTLFPRLGDAEFRTLCEDIAANGLREPITTHDGMILDGGNRYRACLAAGVAPRFVKFSGPSIAAFVLSANLHRRHMSPGQQAAIVATVQDWAKAQPASRPAKECNVAPLSRAADRAATSGASLRTQKMADKVAKEAPALARQVARGEITLPQAHEQIAPRATKPKTVPTIESLLLENAALREELEEAKQNAAELADLLEGYSAAEQGEEAAAREIARLKGQIRTVETQRDTCMTTCNELKRTVAGLKRQIDKKGAKA